MERTDIKVLVACEESQAVCIAFRRLGYEAYSCDIQECSGGHPEWHIKVDALLLLGRYLVFKTEDGKAHYVERWDLIILVRVKLIKLDFKRRWKPKRFSFDF